MHDIDRNQLEFNPEAEAFEYEQFEMPGEAEGVFNEAEVMELAAELLEVRDEQEMDHFLGGLIKKAASAAGSFISSPQGKALGGVLKGMAKKALPIAGTLAGGFFGGPLGAKIGGQLGSMVGGAIRESEMSQEDREYEGAKTFVRLASTAVKNAAGAPPSANPVAVAQNVVARAARAVAPALLGPTAPTSYPSAYSTPAYGSPSNYSTSNISHGRSGRWYRRGNKIVLMGV